MNHLEEAKKGMEDVRAGGSYSEYSGVHALIAIAERQDNNFKSQVRIEKHLSKIAEQLERMNDQELRTEELDYYTVTRKVDK